jgi:hypothetical protein
MSARKVLVVGLVLALSALAVNYSLVSQEAPAKGPIEAFVAEMKAFPGFFNLYLKKDGSLYLEVTQESLRQRLFGRGPDGSRHRRGISLDGLPARFGSVAVQAAQR